MKNIILCCDGTSNDFGDNNSNVVKLYSVLKKDQKTQLTFYDPGVGTPSTYDAFNPITRKLQRGLGNGFGYGLTENIKEAYLYIMDKYEEGDKIFLFGFSRGAYTVRAIAGLINVCGLLPPSNQNLVAEALRVYHLPRNKKSEKIQDSFKETFSRPCQIHFLGLWDTVKSVGWVYNPVSLKSTANNPIVKNVRHAISIDEKRAFFRQNLWGWKNRETVKQVWFAGVHSDVGGSYPREKSGLSNIALEWMLVEAQELGLVIDDIDKARKIVQDIPNPHLADQNKSLTPAWYFAEAWPKLVKVRKGKGEHKRYVSRMYFNLGKRRIIYNKSIIHESVLMRLKERSDYRPANLLKGKAVAEVTNIYSIDPWRKL